MRKGRGYLPFYLLMNVTQLIDLVGQLSFSRNNLTIKERESYLRYLNLANLELWQILINSKQFFQTVNIYLDNDGKNNLPISYYYIKAIFTDKTKLQRCALDKVLDVPAGHYTILNNTFQVGVNTNLLTGVDPTDGVAKKYVTLLVLPSCKTLVENIIYPNTEVDTPIFPEPHHLGLVHGALYYLYISGKGHTEKMKHQLLNWENAKKNIATYYGVE
jgi:hypothetical protein